MDSDENKKQYTEEIMDCIFCKIINGEIPSSKIYENDAVIAFDDIDPKAPAHTLVVPKIHVKNIDELNNENKSMMSDIFMAVQEVARIKGLEKGYRVLINNGKAAHQEVQHLHIHVLGGKDDLGPMLAK